MNKQLILVGIASALSSAILAGGVVYFVLNPQSNGPSGVSQPTPTPTVTAEKTTPTPDKDKNNTNQPKHKKSNQSSPKSQTSKKRSRPQHYSKKFQIRDYTAENIFEYTAHTTFAFSVKQSGGKYNDMYAHIYLPGNKLLMEINHPGEAYPAHVTTIMSTSFNSRRLGAVRWVKLDDGTILLVNEVYDADQSQVAGHKVKAPWAYTAVILNLSDLSYIGRFRCANAALLSKCTAFVKDLEVEGKPAVHGTTSYSKTQTFRLQDPLSGNAFDYKIKVSFDFTVKTSGPMYAQVYLPGNKPLLEIGQIPEAYPAHIVAILSERFSTESLGIVQWAKFNDGYITLTGQEHNTKGDNKGEEISPPWGYPAIVKKIGNRNYIGRFVCQDIKLIDKCRKIVEHIEIK